MPNKLRRNKVHKNAGCSREDQGKSIEVIVLSSESGWSDGEEPFNQNNSTPLGKDKQKDSNALPGCSGPGMPQQTDQSIKEVAPNFLCTTFKGKCKKNDELSKTSPGKLPPLTVLDPSLEEIQSFNPTFPVIKVFNTLQKKACLKRHEFTHSDKGFFHTNPLQPVQNNRQEKIHQESFVDVQKLQSQSPKSTPKQLRPNRLSRSRRLKRESCKLHEVANHETNSTNQTKREPFCEDVLWTDKYAPQHSSEIIGNSASVEKLHSWLKKWKLRTDMEEMRKYKEKEVEETSNNCWDCGDFQDEEGFKDQTEEQLVNTILITGPPGVGKTTSVYACAKELGFKVFEVNCSSQRCGREVLTQLQEATQSHLVETSGKDPLKPAFFSSYNTSRCPAKFDTLPVKKRTLQNRSISTFKKRRVKSGRAKATPVTLTNYFKMKARADVHCRGLPPAKKATNTLSEPLPSNDQKVFLNKKMATSLILFEEVDIIFDDDVGFLAAIKAFMITTKRPVVLTTSDPLFKESFNASMEEIIFKNPQMADVCSYLQLVCLAEKVRLDWDDVNTLFKVTRGDIRHCLLQLQLWANSGGGQCQSLNARGLDCYKGCSANMLGLQSVTQEHVQLLLKDTIWTEQELTELLWVMTESRRNGLPLLYTNLETLLFTEANENPLFNKTDCSGPDSDIHISDKPMKKTSGQLITRSAAKTKYRLSKRKCNASLSTPSKDTQITHLPNGSSQKAQNPGDRMTTSDCLGALADFFDSLSFTDIAGPSHKEEFFWTGAEIQEGLADEGREEEAKTYSQERWLDIQATVEALSFHNCWRQFPKLCSKVQRCREGDAQLKRSFPESCNTKRLNFILQPLHLPIVSQRFELSKAVLSSQHFCQLLNRRAVCTDYMPVIRFICRTHRKHQQKQESVRCLKSLRTQLGLSKETIRLLAEEFS